MLGCAVTGCYVVVGGVEEGLFKFLDGLWKAINLLLIFIGLEGFFLIFWFESL